MNLVEQLLAIDKDKPKIRKQKKMKSQRMTELLKKDENDHQVREITIQELNGKQFNELNAMMYNKDGSRDFSRAYDVNAMYCVYGVVDPPLRSPQLMEHFGVTNPKDLAKMLFGVECGKISDEIVRLSGVSGESEEEVKNSSDETEM